MADTYTTNLNLTKPEPGAAEDTWGISLNSDLDTLDAIFSSSGTQVNLNPNQVNFADNKKAIFGTGSDLSIFHNSTNNHSVIAEVGTGDLRISASNLVFSNSAATETKAIFNTNGAVELYHDNARKFKTTSTGIDVTGTVTSDGLKIVDSTTSNISLMEDGSSGADIKYIGSNNNFVIATGTGGAGSQTQRLSIQRDTGDISFYDDTGSTQGFFWDASTERLGIGTTSPSQELVIRSAQPTILLEDSDNNAFGSIEVSSGNINISADGGSGIASSNIDFLVDGSQKIRIDSDGRLGIGTTSPNYLADLEGTGSTLLRLNSTSGESVLQISVPDTTSFADINFGDSGSTTSGQIRYRHNGDSMAFSTGGSEKVRIDSNGHLLVAKTASDGTVIGAELRNNGIITSTVSGNLCGNFNRKTSDGTIVNFQKDSTTVGGIRSFGGDLEIQTGITGLRFNDGSDAIHPVIADGSVSDNATDLGLTNARFKDLHLSGTGYFGTSVGIGTSSPQSNRKLHVVGTLHNIAKFERTGNAISHIEFSGSTTTAQPTCGSNGNDFTFNTNYLERVRIDSSGNFLVGKSSASQDNTVGTEIKPTRIISVSDSIPTLVLNRKTSDGAILSLKRDNTVKAQIGVLSASAGLDAYFASGSSSTTGAGLRFINVTSSLYIGPCRGDGTLADDTIDLGSSGSRFDDIYATNGTIQTSDRNEKQDIQELSDAEQRVATACKGLIRRYKFNSAVEEKGDDARYHFGIIAQDLQDAFTTEGLDAGDYGMFISDTYTDDNGIEQTRLGVRYNELLAFIIATL